MRLKSGIKLLEQREGTGEPARKGDRVIYNMKILLNRGDEVPGLVFSSEEVAGHWARLDEFEGEGYERVQVSARLRDGSQVQAYVYQLSGR